jgi:hypothetical protein
MEECCYMNVLLLDQMQNICPNKQTTTYFNYSFNFITDYC